MDLITIALIVLALVAIWAVVELALTLRRARGTVEELDKTVVELNATLEQSRPVVAKLDETLDELQPAVAHVEPLLKQAGIAVEALSADLIEVNGVLRDVSAVSGAASAASNAVSGVVDGASEKVHQLFGRARKPEVAAADRPLVEGAPSEAGDNAPAAEQDAPAASGERGYYTYDATEEAAHV